MERESFAALEAWLQPLLDQLRPAERRLLARDLARGLRARQAQRIAGQRNVDGSPYRPRAKRRAAASAKVHGIHRRQRDRIGAMFAKLRTQHYLRALANAAQATVEITGRTARIAKIHQFGMLDRPQPDGPSVRYPRRELLGISADDQVWIQARLRSFLANELGP